MFCNPHRLTTDGAQKNCRPSAGVKEPTEKIHSLENTRLRLSEVINILEPPKTSTLQSSILTCRFLHSITAEVQKYTLADKVALV